MKKKRSNRELLLTISAFIFVVTVVVGLGFLKVWREEQNKQLSRLRSVQVRELDGLRSECATLELAISELSTTERLTRYAEDSLGLVLPSADQIIPVERLKSGLLVSSKKTVWQRFKGWFGRGKK